MLIEIKPLEDYEWNCIGGNVASVATFWGRNFMLALSKTWTFADHKLSDSIYESYKLLGQSIVDAEEIIKLTDIEIDIHENVSMSKALEIITDELYEKRPVLISIDIFCCPWFLEAYRIAHALHFILAIGEDVEKGVLYCTDVSKMAYGHSLTMEDFEAGFMGMVTTFSKMHDTIDAPQKYDYFSAIKNSAQMMLGSGSVNKLDSMRSFADRLLDLYSLAQEEKQSLAHKYFAATKLYAEILNALQGRMHFSHLLEYIGKQYDNPYVMSLSKEMQSVANMWKSIKLLLVKADEKNGDIYLLKGVAGRIKDVSNIEEEIARKILVV